ncbi:MAG: amino acid adenylation domain-containing protein [Acidobacteria bacterium]|nr:amino acid adenylation domain-containing protein [Acidobacteriota bacterium]
MEPMASPSVVGFRLSPLQRRLWLRAGGSGAAAQCAVAIEGRLRPPALRDAAQRVVARHEILRTTFQSPEGQGVKVPFQVVHEHLEPAWRELSLADLPAADQGASLRRLLDDERDAGADLAHGPLLRLLAVGLGPDRYALVVTLPVLCADSRSLRQLVLELLGACGPGTPRSEEPLQYADVSAWQNELFRADSEDENVDAARTFWRRQGLGGGDLPPLPGERPAVAEGGFEPRSVRLDLTPDLPALASCARAHGVTLSDVLLGGWMTLLWRLGGGDRTSAGVVFDGRRHAEMADALGLFARWLPVRGRFDPRQRFHEVLRQVADARAEVAEWQDYADWEEGGRDSREAASHAAGFDFEDWTAAAPGGGPGRLLERRIALEPFRVQLDCLLRPDGLTVDLHYDAAVLSEPAARGVARRFLALLQDALADPGRTCAELDLLGPEERDRLLVSFNASAAPVVTARSVQERFERQVRLTPAATAAVFEGDAVTYDALNRRANRLAHHLRALGIGPEDRVAIGLERSLDVVVALLGVLKSGAAFVPLDPAYPAARLAAMLAQAGAKAILGAAGGSLPDTGIPTVLPGDPELSSRSETDPLPLTEPENLAYVLFTSGSTGRPKAVAIEHRHLLHYLEGILRRLDLPSGASFATVSTLAADLGNTAIYPALCTGGTLHLISQERASDPAAFAEYCRRHRIDCLKIVPSHLVALMSHERPEEILPQRRLVVGGEALGWDLVRDIRESAPELQILNHYGPTETTVGVMTGPAAPAADRGAPGTAGVPLGAPLPGSRVYVLDGRLEPVPVGVPGELYVGGGGVSRGYLGNPEATAERFIPNPFDPERGSRLYRTGDLVRFVPGDHVEFLGRVDHQIKLRGFRIELGEIEAVLESHAGIREAVVTVYERPAGKKHLAAYVVLRSRYDLNAAALRRFVRERLPEPMNPSAYVFLNAMPLTTNGKLDRRALPPPDEEAGGGRFVAPRTPVEETLARIWGEVLELDRVGVHDNFFELGGDSIVSIQVLARTSQAGLTFTPQQVFQHQTIAELAALAAAPSAPVELAPAVPFAAAAQDVYPASRMQRAMLFFAQLAPAAGIYLDQAVYTLRGDLDAVAFRHAWEGVVSRHAALRTGFRWAGSDEPLQAVEQHPELPWQEEDWRHLRPEAQRDQLEAWLAADRRRGFDLGRAPLVRVALVRLAETVYKLIWTFHHVVLDGWSVARVLSEVSVLYKAFAQGREAGLAPSRPYGDYIRWLQTQDPRAGQAVWTRALQGFTAPTPLPFRPGLHPPGERPHADMAARLGGETTDRLRTLARQNRLTLNTLVQGAWALLLHHYSGEPDVVFGATNSGRPPELAGVESMIGLFINTLPVRVVIDPGAPVVPWLRGLQDGQAELRLHQHTSLIEIQGWSDVPRGLPLFESLVVFDNFPVDEMVGDFGAGIEADADFQFFNRTNFALSLGSWPARQLPLELRYESGRFERATIHRFLGHLTALLESLSLSPGARLSDLRLLADTERHQILTEWNDTASAYGRSRSILDAIGERAAEQPEAVAVLCGEAIWSYREVEEEASRLALQLRELGVGPGDLVAVHLHRCAEMVPALLGILKSGAAYVPVEVSLPPARVSWLLSTLGIRCAVTQGRRVEALAELDLPRLEHLLLVEDHEPAAHGRLRLWGRQSRRGLVATPQAPPGPEDLAYVIFTSGSTGTPKGVMVRHRPVVNLIEWVNASFRMGPGDRVLFVTALSFDLSVYDVFGLLSAGGSVRVASEAELQDPALLVRALEEEAITYWDSAPAALQQLVPFFSRASRAEGRSPLRLVFLSGDWVPLGLPGEVRKAFPRARVVALGGATEATVWSNRFPVEEVERDWTSIPYGRPIQNARYHVLDRSLDPCPIGVGGDLYIGGECLALGYLQDPALTAWKLVPDGCGEGRGARLYRTGDRARYWGNGLLEFLGRLDTQVKVRGFRIELGEIETALGEHPKVRETVVLVREDAPGDRRLVAYVVPREEAVEAGELRVHLRERLPEYMVPAAFVFLDAMPVTANGKLDRKALPAPERSRAADGEGFVAPRNAAEELLAATWTEVLGLDRVGVHDNFFTLGGHSLIATRLVARVRETFGVELTLRRLLDGPTVAEVAAAVAEAAQAGAGLVPPPITRLPRDAEPQLSFAQERLWFLEQLEPGTMAYNVHAALQLDGPLDGTALAAVLGEIARRHEVLRTTFRVDAGRPVPEIHPPEPFDLRPLDLSDQPMAERAAEVARLAREEAERPFDLATGPLLRLRLLRLGEREHVALVTTHHIASDGWSIQVFLRELAELYSAFSTGRSSPLPELPVQYADFAAWQRSWLRDEVLQRQLAYWRDRLAGVPAVLDLPTDRPRGPVASFEGAAESLSWPPGLAEGLKEWSRHQRVTLFMTLLATFEALLSRYSGQPVVAVGTPIAGRHHVETEGLIGLFVNTLVMRGDLEGDPGLRELVGRVRETALGAQAHQDLPFEKLVEELRPERSLSHTPLFQVVFALENAGGAPVELPGLTLRLLEGEVATTKFDLVLSLVEGDGRLGGMLRYRTALFDRPTVARLGAHWVRLVEQAMADPELPLSYLPLLGEAERQQLTVEWNDGGSPGSWDLCVHQLFERQAAATPDAPAVVCEDRRLSYAELNRLANRLAYRLRRLGVGLETVAGILIEPSIEMVVAMLAIHKAGGGYLGLDLALPRQRLAFLLADARVPAVVTREGLAGRLAGLGVAVVSIETAGEGLDRESEADPVAGATPDHLAYVIYTSGSTGEPKGVAGQHSQLRAYLHGILERLGPPAGASFALQQSLAVDAPITYLFASLCHGGVLHLITPERLSEPAALADLLGRQPVDYLKVAPSHLAVLMASGYGERILPRRLLLVGGEASYWDRVQEIRRSSPGCIYLNHYGPTETTVGVLTYRADEPVAAPGSNVLPLGRPLTGARVHVLDPRFEPLPIGIPGELAIGGGSLARGYLGRPDLTAARFIPDPFGGEPGSRLYRTGDLARCTPAGLFEFLGRLDHQVKVRGFRVELEEIEVALSQHPGVIAAVVVAWADAVDGKRLVGYLVPAGDPAPTTSELRRFLLTKLPEHMVPASFMPLERLPRTPQGKVDRRALPEPERVRPDLDDGFVAPGTAEEEVLAAIWADMLGIERVGIHDNFFDLGGHSLLATRVIARVREAFAVDLPLRTLFDAPTVEGLSGEIGRVKAGGLSTALPGITPVARENRRLKQTTVRHRGRSTGEV